MRALSLARAFIRVLRVRTFALRVRARCGGGSLSAAPFLLARCAYPRQPAFVALTPPAFRLLFASRQLGSTAVGIQTKEGVVIAVEKRVTSPLLEADSIEKVFEISRHIGCAASGLTADARTLIEHARVECAVRLPQRFKAA